MSILITENFYRNAGNWIKIWGQSLVLKSWRGQSPEKMLLIKEFVADFQFIW